MRELLLYECRSIRHEDTLELSGEVGVHAPVLSLLSEQDPVSHLGPTLKIVFPA